MIVNVCGDGMKGRIVLSEMDGLLLYAGKVIVYDLGIRQNRYVETYRGKR